MEPRARGQTARPLLTEHPVRAAEVVGALSLATDLGTGQPLEHALRTALLAVRLGELAGATPEELHDAYYVALLHSAGCTSDGHEQAQLYGDDIAPRAAFALVDPGNAQEVLAFFQDQVGRGRPPEVRAAMLEDTLMHALPAARAMFAMHCEVAAMIAGRLGCGPRVQAALAHVFERWDGLGFPSVTSGEAIPLPTRLLHVARDISVFLSASGRDGARTVVQRRSGTAYEPVLAELAVLHLDEMLDELDETRIWDQAMEREPFPTLRLEGEQVDRAFTAIAAFTALKSPWFREHQVRVAGLAEAAAWRAGLPAESAQLLRRAGLAHDLGRTGVTNTIWEKPGRLGVGEWERVRLYPYFTERAFAQSPSLAAVALLAGSHHERLDGSGYHRGAQGPSLARSARILTAADCYQAMREPRPYRPPLDAAETEAELRQEVKLGRLDADAVDDVLAAAGHHVSRQPRELPAGLTERELEVLQVLVLGQSNQAIGERLNISAKTVGHHVQHIYAKAGVNSRAAATLWAFDQHLVGGA